MDNWKIEEPIKVKDICNTKAYKKLEAIMLSDDFTSHLIDKINQDIMPKRCGELRTHIARISEFIQVSGIVGNEELYERLHIDIHCLISLETRIHLILNLKYENDSYKIISIA